MAPDHTETSPLLGSTESAHGTLNEHSVLPADQERAVVNQSAPGDNDDVPRAPVRDAGEYEGLPEVRKQLKYIVPAVSIGIFLVAADQTVIASSAGKIGSDLNALKNTSWIATAYLLTITSIQPLFGKLSDIFGRKTCLLWAYFVFGIGCLWCGTASSIESLILARAFTGIGGGGMTTCVSIMMSDIVPLRERGTWQGIINIVFATGSGVGAPLGGFLSDTIGWRWAFTAQFPLCVLAFISVFFLLKLPYNDKTHWRSKLSRVDFPGAVTLVTSVTLLLLGLDQGSNNSWSSPVTITCLSLFIPLMLAFGLIEKYWATEPFAPSRIIFERSQLAAYLCNFFGFAGWFAIVFYIPLFYQGAFNLSATQSGVRLLPAIIASLPASLVVGLVIQKSGKLYWLTVTTYVLLTAGAVVIMPSISPSNAPSVGITIGLAIAGIGAGGATTASLIALLSNATVQDQAITTACSYLFRSLGCALGISLPSAVLQYMLRLRLNERLGRGDEAHRLADRIRESLDYIRTLDPATQAIVRRSYQESTLGVFGLSIAFTSLAVISSFFIREKRLSV